MSADITRRHFLGPTGIGLALGPEFAVVFVVVAFNLMGDGLRDALDPRG